MSKKSEQRKKNDNKTRNKKSANPITLEVDSDMKGPVKGVPEV
ncbi:hypothetical protein SH2C18_09820 [Clostridium sediminicola]